MHEMWCGTDTSGEAMWHVLTADKNLTLCGVEKAEELSGQAPTDKHCFLCMKAFQAALTSTS
ncbi:hypothetical protein ACWC2T_35520 [Streptomyces sp. NPDC001393]